LAHILDTTYGERIAERYEIREAIQLLARHPRETVPILVSKLTANHANAIGADASLDAVCHALGLAGTPDAVAALKASALEQRSYQRVASVINALLLARVNGTMALEALYPVSSGNLKLFIERYRAGIPADFGRDTALPFPAIPEKLELPKICQWRHGPMSHRTPTHKYRFPRHKFVCEARRLASP
jgi:hypothetical protein